MATEFVHTTHPVTSSVRLPSLLVMFALADGLTSAGLSGLGEILPSLHQHWHVDYGTLGLALGLLRLAALVGALWIGPRADRLPLRPLLVTVLATIALSWLALPVVGSLTPALLLFALLGAACGAHMVLITVAAPRLQAQAPAGATALLTLAFLIGSAVGPALRAASLLITGGASGLALVLAVSCLPLILAYGRLPIPDAFSVASPAGRLSGAPATAGDSCAATLRRELWLLSTILFLLVGVGTSFSTWAFTLLGPHNAVSATVPLVNWLGQAAGAVPLALGATRGWRTPTFSSVPIAAVVIAGALIVFALGSPLVVVLAAAAVMGWAQGPIFALTAVRAMALRPAAAGRIGGLIMAANQAGAMVLPTLAGLVISQGRAATAGTLIGASLLMAVLARIALRREQHPQSSQTLILASGEQLSAR